VFPPRVKAAGLLAVFPNENDDVGEVVLVLLPNENEFPNQLENEKMKK
jgi:hypothetical protein